MPEEPINNSPNQPVDVEANDQVNNFNNEVPVSVPNTEVPIEPPVEGAPAIDTQTFSETVSETPVLDNDMGPSDQSSDSFAADPVVGDETESNPTPFMAPESLPVQSVGSEPTLPPSPEAPSKNKLLIPILVAGIVIIVLAVAGYFLAKYLF